MAFKTIFLFYGQFRYKWYYLKKDKSGQLGLGQL